MEWKFFLGAALLTAALVMPHARFTSVVGGIALARGIQYAMARRGGVHRKK
jgi:hypothetical protein